MPLTLTLLPRPRAAGPPGRGRAWQGPAKPLTLTLLPCPRAAGPPGRRAAGGMYDVTN
jgi:hypothetical protein